MEKYDDGLNIESKEKPPFLYHGTTSFGVEEFEPRKISTPGV
ncbi:MAG: hypothetical protein NT077_03215 [Candidatus Taylorbacteria bacterium]|nr:hypothetical protein [Candidatus Taylorbacteria bacterium]